MNNVNLVGRITADLDVRYTQSGKAVTNFSLAVNRRKKDEVDFISVIVWDKLAENLAKYQGKGSQIAVSGRLCVSNYEKDGKKIYKTEVIAEEIEYLGSKSGGENQNNQNKDFGVPLDDFSPMEEDDDDLPF